MASPAAIVNAPLVSQFGLLLSGCVAFLATAILVFSQLVAPLHGVSMLVLTAIMVMLTVASALTNAYLLTRLRGGTITCGEQRPENNFR